MDIREARATGRSGGAGTAPSDPTNPNALAGRLAELHQEIGLLDEVLEMLSSATITVRGNPPNVTPSGIGGGQAIMAAPPSPGRSHLTIQAQLAIDIVIAMRGRVNTILHTLDI